MENLKKENEALKKENEALNMKKIRLTGNLDYELKMLGIKTNDIVNVEEFNRTTGAAYFKKYIGNLSINCVVWPENYEILEKKLL